MSKRKPRKTEEKPAIDPADVALNDQYNYDLPAAHKAIDDAHKAAAAAEPEFVSDAHAAMEESSEFAPSAATAAELSAPPAFDPTPSSSDFVVAPVDVEAAVRGECAAPCDASCDGGCVHPALQARLAIEIDFELLDGPLGGYVSTRLDDVTLTSRQARALRVLAKSLMGRGELLESGRQIQKSAHAVQWLLDQVAAAIDAQRS